MSYTRRFSKTVEVDYSGTVSYPASQSGGTASFSGTAYETVDFVVHVDTDPFDECLDDMKRHVDLLTGSVVATQTAHVKAKADASQQIGNAIVRGFFKTVQSDISQQTVELKNKAQALLLQLNKLAEQCNDKSRQMGVDYARLVDRYTKVFTDLDNELQNRIYSIDEPIFHATHRAGTIALMGTGNDMVSTVAVAGAESARAHSVISASRLKDQALNAIDKGKRFLEVQYRADALLDRSLRPGGERETFSVPYCMLEAVSGRGYTSTSVFTPLVLDRRASDELKERVGALSWQEPLPAADRDAIADYFNAEVATNLIATARSEHDSRVAAMTSRLFDLASTRTPGKTH